MTEINTERRKLDGGLMGRNLIHHVETVNNTIDVISYQYDVIGTL